MLTDGTIGRIHLKRSLDLDLDQAAVAAIRRWRLAPAMKDGKPISCRIEIEMKFPLR